MKNKSEKAVGVRVLNALCVTIVLVSGVYILLAGIQIVALTAMACSIVAVTVPAVMSGDGIMEMLMGVLEAIFDGIMAIFEAIANILSGIFG